MSASPTSRLPLRTAVILFLFLNSLYLLTSTGRVHTIDEISVVMQAESLTLRGTSAIPQAVRSGVFFGKVARDGQPYSPYPPGQALAIVPWYELGQVVSRVPGIPAANRDLVVSMTATWSNASFAALTGTLAFLLACALGLGRRDALIAPLVIALATPLFVYSGWLFSEPLTAACWVGAALALFGIPAEEPISLRRALIAGLLLGFALFVRATNVLTPVLFLAAMFVRDRRRAFKPAIALALVVGVFGTLFLLRNYALFGSPLDFGYPKTAEAGRETASFNMSMAKGLFALLFSPGKSTLLFCPVVILAALALPRLWARDRGLALVCAATPLAYLLFYSHYSGLEGGYSYGPRYLVPALVLGCVALAAWFLHPKGDNPPRLFRPALIATFLVGLFVQVVGLSTNVIEDMVANHYYDSRYFYQLGYSPITGQLRLIGKYLGGAPAPLGMGFDRWFLFAAKAGVPAWIIAVLALPMVVLLLVSGTQLARTLRRCD